MARILKDTDATITQTFYVNGTATDVGTVTVTISRTNGTALYTDAATTNNADGTYDYTLTDTDTNRLDRLTFEWTASTSSQTLVSHVEVVGGHLTTEADVRAFDPALSNTTNFPDADILNVRDRVTDLLEHWTKRSWVPRFRYGKWAGTGSVRIYVQDAQQTRGGSGGEGAKSDLSEFIAGDIAGSAVTVTDVTVVDGGFYLETGVWSAATRSDPLNVVAEWEYGLENLVDGVDRIALLLIRDYLTRGPISQDSISAANDFGTMRFVVEGGPMRNVSKIAEVNDWVRSHSARTPLVV